MTEDEVKSDIRKYLKSMEASHPPTVLWFERLQSGVIHNGNQHVWLSREGTADFIIVLINKKKSLSVIFCEAKKTGVYEPREGAQVDFRDTYGSKHIDMTYMIAQSVDDLRVAINEIGIDQVAGLVME